MIRRFYYKLTENLGGESNFFWICALTYCVSTLGWLYVNTVYVGDSTTPYILSDIGIAFGLAALMLYFGAVALAILLTPVVWFIEKRLEKQIIHNVLAP